MKYSLSVSFWLLGLLWSAQWHNNNNMQGTHLIKFDKQTHCDLIWWKLDILYISIVWEVTFCYRFWDLHFWILSWILWQFKARQVGTLLIAKGGTLLGPFNKGRVKFCLCTILRRSRVKLLVWYLTRSLIKKCCQLKARPFKSHQWFWSLVQTGALV